MRVTHVDELDIYDIGNSIQFIGAILEGRDRVFLVPFPDQDTEPILTREPELLALSHDDWRAVLRQSDVADVRTPSGAILRKGERQMDSNVAWRVYERDDFRCCYCGKRKPLTVDHIDLWENGGATVEDNLLSSCRSCNKLRGNREYDEWLDSQDYQKRLSRLTAARQTANRAIVTLLPHLKTLRVANQRER
jgi:5-methylcytosine-specific restriction endonuclease McrA